MSVLKQSICVRFIIQQCMMLSSNMLYNAIYNICVESIINQTFNVKVKLTFTHEEVAVFRLYRSNNAPRPTRQ